MGNEGRWGQWGIGEWDGQRGRGEIPKEKFLGQLLRAHVSMRDERMATKHIYGGTCNLGYAATGESATQHANTDEELGRLWNQLAPVKNGEDVANRKMQSTLKTQRRPFV